MIKPHMDVVCVIDVNQSDNLNQRKKALDEVKLACYQIGANLNPLQVSRFNHISSCTVAILVLMSDELCFIMRSVFLAS